MMRSIRTPPTWTLLLCLWLQSSPVTASKFNRVVVDDKGLIAADYDQFGHKLVISSVEAPTQLWDMQQTAKLHVWRLNAAQAANFDPVALSADGHIGATALGRQLVAWDAVAGNTLGYWQVDARIQGLSLTDDGRWALLRLGGHRIQLLDLLSGDSLWQVDHPALVEAIALSADGSLAAVGCDDGTTSVWDIAANKRLYVLTSNNKVRYVALSPRNRWLLISTPFSPIELWDLRTGKKQVDLVSVPGWLAMLSRPNIHVSHASFTPNEELLVTGAPPRDVYVWKLPTGTLTHRFKIPKHAIWKPTAAIVYATAISADHSRVHACASDGRTYTWRLEP